MEEGYAEKKAVESIEGLCSAIVHFGPSAEGHGRGTRIGGRPTCMGRHTTLWYLAPKASEKGWEVRDTGVFLTTLLHQYPANRIEPGGSSSSSIALLCKVFFGECTGPLPT